MAQEEDKPVQEIQIFRLNKIVAKHPQGKNIKNNYLRNLGKKNIRELTRKECAHLIVVELQQESDSMYDSGGDKQ